jgi:hypothetical protein
VTPPSIAKFIADCLHMASGHARLDDYFALELLWGSGRSGARGRGWVNYAAPRILAIFPPLLAVVASILAPLLAIFAPFFAALHPRSLRRAL